MAGQMPKQFVLPFENTELCTDLQGSGQPSVESPNSTEGDKKAKAKAWRLANQDAIKSARRRYLDAHKEEHRERSRKFRQEHHEECKAAQREYAKNHRAERNEYFKKYKAANPEWSVSYRENYKKRKNELNKQYRNTPGKREKYIERMHRRRELGFIPLNVGGPGMEAHHINKNEVIFIPTKLHHSVAHSIWTGRNMDQINALAWEYLSYTKRIEVKEADNG